MSKVTIIADHRTLVRPVLRQDKREPLFGDTVVVEPGQTHEVQLDGVIALEIQHETLPG